VRNPKHERARGGASGLESRSGPIAKRRYCCHDHYDVLRTIEDNFGLRAVGGEDGRSDPIVEGVWRDAPR